MTDHDRTLNFSTAARADQIARAMTAGRPVPGTPSTPPDSAALSTGTDSGGGAAPRITEARSAAVASEQLANFGVRGARFSVAPEGKPDRHARLLAMLEAYRTAYSLPNTDDVDVYEVAAWASDRKDFADIFGGDGSDTGDWGTTVNRVAAELKRAIEQADTEADNADNRQADNRNGGAKLTLPRGALDRARQQRQQQQRVYQGPEF